MASLERDEQIKILEVLEYASALPARPVADVITPNKVYYSISVATLLGQDLSERQLAEVRRYLTRIEKLETQENDAIDRMAMRSVGRGDIEFNDDEPARLRQDRWLCGERIRQVLGLPDKWVYYADFR